MTVTLPVTQSMPRAQESSIARLQQFASIPFVLGVLCSYFGFSWDVQWHVDVGPDTFFTLPHLVLYGGSAIAGLTCLVVTLLTTAAARRGDPAALNGSTPVLGGMYRAPLGYLIGGFGAAGFLLYGLLDQWWHQLYGFDVTLVSPPHVGLILSILVGMAGALVLFANGAAFPRRWQIVGVAVTASALFSYITPTLMESAPWVVGLFAWPGLSTILLYPAMLLLVVSIVRTPGMATIAAAVFTLMLGIGWVTLPWVTREYAASIGLFLRDTTANFPVVPGTLPTYLLAAAVVVDFVVWAARRNGWPVRTGVALAGALAGLTLLVLQLAPPAYQGSTRENSAEVLAMLASNADKTRFATIAAGIVIGALTGMLGWNLGILAKRAGEASAPAHDAIETVPASGAGEI